MKKKYLFPGDFNNLLGQKTFSEEADFQSMDTLHLPWTLRNFLQDTSYLLTRGFIPRTNSGFLYRLCTFLTYKTLHTSYLFRISVSSYMIILWSADYEMKTNQTNYYYFVGTKEPFRRLRDCLILIFLNNIKWIMMGRRCCPYDLGGH